MMSASDAKYYPILRGRQNELIAIRELASAKRLSNVVPIIEPVKASSTLIKTLDEAFNHNSMVGVIHNPQVGSFNRDLRNNPGFEEHYLQLLSAHRDKVQIFVRVASIDRSELELTFSRLDDQHPHACSNWNAIMSRDTKRDVAIAVQTYLEQGVFSRAIAPFPKPLNYFRANRILLTGGFNVQTRNADYRTQDDEFFSDAPSSYQMYGCDGFSDYSIVGEPYKTGGFSPRAVALHLTYFDEDDDIRIKHFVSEPPDDTKDIARKYASAARSLCEWADKQDHTTLPRTNGLEQFFQTLKEERFPGLGSAKRYSILHHLEMVDVFLGNVL